MTSRAIGSCGENLAALYNLGNREPNIQVYDVDVRGDRSLTLRHYLHQNRPLDRDSTHELLKHLHRLWGFDVKLDSVDQDNIVQYTFITKNTGSKEQVKVTSKKRINR